MSDADAVRQSMQYKAFTTWCNLHLKKANLELANLKTDFADGIKLIRLIEVISEESLGKYNKKPISKFQKVENLNLALKFVNDFLKDMKISNQYSAENILEENEVLILGMVWSLILRFAVEEISEGDRTAKEGLLLWAQKKIGEASGGTIKVNNFHNSWQDGTAFCSLIHAFRPDLIDYSTVHATDDKTQKMKNLNLAFDTSQEHLGIPKMLDADDMTKHRPDEKSVMTYVSFFWKEFASNKKKALAAERISKVVAREVEFTTLQTTYEVQARTISAWLQDKHALFSAGTKSVAANDLHATLEAYVDYARAERPAKIQEFMEAEAVFTSISSCLGALGRSYEPPEDCALPAMKRWWEELTLAEQAYEGGIKALLSSAKRMGGMVKLFNSKASKLDAWLAAKAAWLQAAQDAALAQLGKPPAVVSVKRIALPVVAGAGAEVFERLADPTLAPPPAIPARRLSDPPPLPPGFASGPDAAMPTKEARAITTPSTDASFVNEDTPVDDDDASSERKRNKRSSFFGNLFAAMGTESSSDATEAGGDGEEAVEATPSRASAPVLTSRMSVEVFSDELKQETARQAELDSVAAVIAKINLFRAYEEEQASRKLSLEALQGILDELSTMTCPVLGKIEKRYNDLKKGAEALAAAASAYHADLEAVLQLHQDLDKERLAFAKRAEALNRWIEESLDAMSEVLAVDNPTEADRAQAELEASQAELVKSKGECESLRTLEATFIKHGPNPYSRFHVNELELLLMKVEGAAAERLVRLGGARERIAEIDSMKKAFAEAAERALVFVRGEKAIVEEKTKEGGAIHPDDPESITKGTEKLGFLHEYASKAAGRAESLGEAQSLADALWAAAEMDNPYTRESMATLKSALDQVEKRVRDVINFIEGQLARALASITPEQKAELEEAFKHFDKSQDGKLNQVEFSAAMKSMDFEGVEAEFPKYSDCKSTNAEGFTEMAISFDSFLTIVLQQYKDKDTMDGLLSAFRTLANGKDALPSSVLDCGLLQPTDAVFLRERLSTAADGSGLDYAPFSKLVYGGLQRMSSTGQLMGGVELGGAPTVVS